MWHDMLEIQIPVAEKVLRTVVVYVVIVALFRFSGKRSLANLNTFDFVVIFLLSNVVQNAIIGRDDSLLGGVIGAVTLVVVNALLNRWLAADVRAAHIVEGTSTTVIQDGSILERASKRLALRSSEARTRCPDAERRDSQRCRPGTPGAGWSTGHRAQTVQDPGEPW